MTFDDAPLQRPAWSFGVWLTSSAALDSADEEALLAFVDLLADSDVPLVGVEFAAEGDDRLGARLRERGLRVVSTDADLAGGTVADRGDFKRQLATALLSEYARIEWPAAGAILAEDDEALEILRHFTRVRYRLAAYLSMAGAEDGVPLVRPMATEFPDDPACSALDDQYMLGPALLVAPVVASSGEVSFYLPDGEWTSPLNGERVAGGRWVTETHGYDSLPLYARPGAILPWGSELTRPDYDVVGGLEIDVFPGGPQGVRHLRLVQGDGTHVLVTLHIEGGRATAHLDDGTPVNAQVL